LNKSLIFLVRLLGIRCAAIGKMLHAEWEVAVTGDKQHIERRQVASWLSNAVSQDSAETIAHLEAIGDQVARGYPELAMTSRVINNMIACMQQTPEALATLYQLSIEELSEAEVIEGTAAAAVLPKIPASFETVIEGIPIEPVREEPNSKEMSDG
jgi:hypothetical protein